MGPSEYMRNWANPESAYEGFMQGIAEQEHEQEIHTANNNWRKMHGLPMYHRKRYQHSPHYIYFWEVKWE